MPDYYGGPQTGTSLNDQRGVIQDQLFGNATRIPIGEFYFFDRILLSDYIVDLGFITADTSFDFTIFNNYKEESKVCSSIVDVNGSDIPIVSGPTPPFTLKPFEERSYTVSVPSDGESIIDTSYTFVFPDANNVTIQFTGQRNFPPIFKHNWLDGYSLTRSFETSVFEAGNAGESRASIYEYPIKSFDLFFRSNDFEEMHKQISLINRTMTGTYPLPIYSDPVEITSIDTGTNTIYGDFSYRHFYGGTTVISVTTNPQTFLYTVIPIKILEAYDDRLVADQVVDTNLVHVGDTLFPILECRQSISEVGISRSTEEKTECTLAAVEDLAGTTLPLTKAFDNTLATITETGAYQGDLLFDFNVNWRDGVEETHFTRADEIVLDYGRALNVRSSRPMLKFELNHLFSTRKDIWRMMLFFDTVKGRRDFFWMRLPLTPFTVLDQNLGSVTIAGWNNTASDITDFYEYIYIEENDGNLIIAKIDSVDKIASPESYQINSTEIPDPLTYTLKSFGYISKFRFEEDSLTFDFFCLDKAEISVSLIETIDERAIT